MTAVYTPAVACLFCEDIRHEASGQSSLVGVFPARIGARTFPFKIPKLAIFGMVRAPLEKHPSSIAVKITTPWDDDAHVIEGPPDNWMKEEAQVGREHDDTAFFLTINLILGSFEVKSPGKIRVSIIIDGEEHKAGSLNFQLSGKAEHLD